jgi:hypothetical protein
MKLCDSKQGIKSLNFSERRMHGFQRLTNQNSIHEDIKEHIEVRECLPSFGAESFVFHIAFQKCKD